ncbi:MAG: cadmium-translocating P-type ATPase [Methylothermaceae bacterium]|nr:cadmium-translocating P-type ATPase [Methylothermaceae bacterium]
METSQLANYFERFEARLSQWAPYQDIMLLRVIAAVIPVGLFGIDAFYHQPFLYWLGIPFYLVCLGLYLESLLKNVLLMHKVSAELLIVLVMIVTLIDGEPLSGAMVAWFIGLGLYISFTIIRKNREKIEALIRQSKRTAQVLADDQVREIPIRDVRRGDRVLVPKGGMISVDGVILENNSSIDESFVTGEPFPVAKQEGEQVVSGTLNLTAPLVIQAEKNGDESFLAVIGREIEAGLEKKSTLQQRADTTVQILLASVTAYAFLLLFVTGDLHVMATALAVTCPCAWALATPTVFAAAIGRHARENILARGGEPLENMRDIQTLILDKTGTLTTAEPEVSRIIPLDCPEEDLLQLAASVEARFDHPIARSIIEYAENQGIKNFLSVDHAEDLPGRGIKGLIGTREVLIGSPATLAQHGIDIPDIEYTGRAIWVALDGTVKGVIVIRDIMLSEMWHLADAIRAYGIKRVILATGDNEEREAKRVAEYINADECYFNCTPTEKTALVKKYQRTGKVAMVGDGVNDAPALAAAHVGIAIGGQKNVNLAIISSDVVILNQDARGLLSILALSHKMADNIRENYTWATGFNSVGLALATFGLLNPILAAMLHHVSSVFVVVNASRLYFDQIETSFAGPFFRWMDETIQRFNRPETEVSTAEEKAPAGAIPCLSASALTAND